MNERLACAYEGLRAFARLGYNPLIRFNNPKNPRFLPELMPQFTGTL